MWPDHKNRLEILNIYENCDMTLQLSGIAPFHSEKTDWITVQTKREPVDLHAMPIIQKAQPGAY